MNILPQKAGVYRITCIANGKIYVGSTKNFRRRMTQHLSALRHDKHGNPYLQHSFNKYGEKFFQFEVLEICAVDSIKDREQVWLDELRPFERNIGFNIASEANIPASALRGRKLPPRSAEHCAKISAGKMGKPSPRRGVKLTDETREKIKAARAKQVIPPRSDESKAKMSAIMMGKKNALGNKHTPEQIAKISASKTGKKRAPFSEEWRKHLSEAGKGRTISDEQKQAVSRANKGRPCSPETRAKISATKKAKRDNDE